MRRRMSASLLLFSNGSSSIDGALTAWPPRRLECASPGRRTPQPRGSPWSSGSAGWTWAGRVSAWRPCVTGRRLVGGEGGHLEPRLVRGGYPVGRRVLDDVEPGPRRDEPGSGGGDPFIRRGLCELRRLGLPCGGLGVHRLGLRVDGIDGLGTPPRGRLRGGVQLARVVRGDRGGGGPHVALE